MYYKIKIDKRPELQEGRTLQYLANKCKYSRQYITDTFNGKNKITRECAINILKGVADDSIKLAVKLNSEGLENTINYYFDKID